MTTSDLLKLHYWAGQIWLGVDLATASPHGIAHTEKAYLNSFCMS